MSVFILTLRDKSSGTYKLKKNLGVFKTRSGAFSFILNEQNRRSEGLSGGRFGFTSLEEMKYRENEIGYDPKELLLFENDSFATYAEKTVYHDY